MDLGLGGKVVVITGASTGLGRGIALRMAGEGAAVVIGDLREEANPQGFDELPELTTAQVIEGRGGAASFMPCDVAWRADVVGLIRHAIERFGRIDIMVNNAGVQRAGKLLHEFDELDLDICFDVNVRGSFFGAQEAVKAFLEQGHGGNIINIVSTAGLQAHPRQSIFAMSKAAQASLTRSIAVEYGPRGIRANGICPTYTRTGPTHGEAEGRIFDAASFESIPLQRSGEIRDVADLAAFLASERSSFIHGALVPVDGGETLSRYSV